MLSRDDLQRMTLISGCSRAKRWSSAWFRYPGASPQIDILERETLSYKCSI